MKETLPFTIVTENKTRKSEPNEKCGNVYEILKNLM